MSDIDRATRFLRAIWRLHRNSGTAYVCVKENDGRFRNFPITVLHDGGMARERLTAFLHEAEGDLYFTPNLFKAKGRRPDNVLPGRLLYADLDEVDPRALDVRPTVAWMSSPGRYQALWVLSRVIEPRHLAALGKRLVYHTGADKDSWALNKVLRIPGTHNYKYEDAPLVHMLWSGGPDYHPADLVRGLPKVSSAPGSTGSALPDLPNTTAAHLRKRYARKLSRRARKLLTVRTVLQSEDRSARLWELENLCLDAGMTPEETLIVVQASAYNKYAGQRREVRILWTEIQKAARHRSASVSQHRRDGGDVEAGSPDPGLGTGDEGNDDEPTDDDTPRTRALSPTRLSKYLARDVRPPSWLVEQMWGRAAHGVWAGDFKTYKSTLLMDLAVSVASGRPFLGQFDVHRTGSVLYIQEENSHGFMHDRLHRIVQSKGLGNTVHTNGRPRNTLLEFGHDLDLHLLNLTGFDLTNPGHMRGLDEWAAAHKPALIILDPLYRLAPGVDENIAAEMAPILNPLADISNQRDCAIILAHHYNKPNAGNATMRSGHRISGTSVFSRWWESSVYAERAGDSNDYRIKFHNEHREHGSAEPQEVSVEMTADPDTYAIHLADVSDATPDDDEPDNDDAGLKLDSRNTRVAVRTVRSRLGLAHSRDAQRVLKAKGYTLSKSGNKLYAYPPERG